MKWRNIDRKKALALIVNYIEYTGKTEIVEDMIYFSAQDEQYLLRELFNQF